MKQKSVYASLALLVFLAACGKGGAEKMVSLGGAAIDDPAAVARVREGSMLVRGIDEQRMKMEDVQNPFHDFVYAITPGKHTLLAMNIQSGHVIPTENMRCYIIEAHFQPNVAYRLDEDKANWRAVITREDGGAEVASAKMADQQSAFGNPCNWK